MTRLSGVPKKATFVLVPGAWLGAWAWRRVVPLLVQEGHEAHAVTLTGMGERVHLASREVGIETAIQDVLNVMKYEGPQRRRLGGPQLRREGRGGSG